MSVFCISPQSYNFFAYSPNLSASFFELCYKTHPKTRTPKHPPPPPPVWEGW